MNGAAPADPRPPVVRYLQSLPAIRSRCHALLAAPPSALAHFDVVLARLPAVADSLLALIARDYASPAAIPPHSRWRHFEAAPVAPSTAPAPKLPPIDRISPLVAAWKAAGVDTLETVRRLLDLFVVSVLLDAGAGAQWKYRPAAEHLPPGSFYSRSEGLGVASFDWFVAGGFSSAAAAGLPHRVDADGLRALTPDKLRSALQVSDTNPLVGVEGRCQLLQRLGDVCAAHPVYFGGAAGSGAAAPARPGNLLDFLLAHPSTTQSADGLPVVHIDALWDVVIRGFAGIWPPSRTALHGVSLGDVWPCTALAHPATSSTSSSSAAAKSVAPSAEKDTAARLVHHVAPDSPASHVEAAQQADALGLLPFHKLSQWLTYSLIEPLTLAGITVSGVDALTGLAEYRNGGLFVDAGVLVLRAADVERGTASNALGDTVPKFAAYDDVVVEWRGLTVALLDRVADMVRERLGMSVQELPLAKVLEAGTWKAGREMAAKLRPATCGPPIDVLSDGTLF
ncbi:hypothetical protein BC831DRAFT_448027 [Entophlyctis helioformis]|nr:hypothetical protein BC831DRAFT_448027 [Entophlyctis helioformis]